MKRHLWMLVSVFLLGTLLVGCGQFTIKGDNGEETKIDLSGLKDGELGIETEGSDGETETVGFDVNEEDGSASMEMETEDGTFVSNSGEGTELPEGFPKDFPIPDNAKIVMANTLTDQEVTNYQVYFEFSGDAEEAYKAVKVFAEKKGLAISMDQQTVYDGQKNYTVGAGRSDAEDKQDYFIFNLAPDEEIYSASVNYSVPK